MPDLVLGLASGYKWLSLAPFVKSLRQTGFDGNIVLFVGNCPQGTLRAIRKEGVTTIQVGATYPYHSELAASLPFDPSFFDHAAPHVKRYVMYKLFVSKNAGRYARIFLTDVKDVVFQKRPFDFDWHGADICFFQEEATRTIADCTLNSKWIEMPFGASALSAIANQPIICSGTTLGKTPAINSYLDAMLEYMVAHNITQVGGDQGVHNQLVYSRGFPGMRLFANEDGPVLTLAMRRPKITFDGNGNVTNTAGLTPNVVHQYDRFTEIIDRVNARYLTFGQRLWVHLARLKTKAMTRQA